MQLEGNAACGACSLRCVIAHGICSSWGTQFEGTNNSGACSTRVMQLKEHTVRGTCRSRENAAQGAMQLAMPMQFEGIQFGTYSLGHTTRGMQLEHVQNMQKTNQFFKLKFEQL